jgi:hypothetical protein
MGRSPDRLANPKENSKKHVSYDTKEKKNVKE